MNYEKMWKGLKAKLEKDLQFYRDGTECSPIEAPMGVMHCSSVLREMERLENKIYFQDELAKETDRFAHYAKYEGVCLSSLSVLTEFPFKSDESAAYYQGYNGDVLKVDDWDNPCSPWVSLLIDNEWEQFASLNNDVIECVEYSDAQHKEPSKPAAPRCKHCHSTATAFIDAGDTSLSVNHYDENRTSEFQHMRIHVKLCACMNCGAVFVPTNELVWINRAINNPNVFPKKEE